MTLQKHNFLYFTALPPTIDKFSICAEPFHPFLVRLTASPRPRPNHDSTILRVESKNDFDTTILHP